MLLRFSRRLTCFYACILFLSIEVYGQTTLNFEFNNTLNETGGIVPPLNVLGTGAFLNESLPDITSYLFI